MRVEEGEWGILFCIVAGLYNKDEKFWGDLREWEVIVLIETWVEEKDWGKVRKWLSLGYEWGVQWASRRNKKGRAAEGMMMGIRKGSKEAGTEIKTSIEGFIEGSVEKDGLAWRIVGVYVREGIEKALEGWTGVREKGVTIIGRDFNARMGREGGSKRKGNR